MPSAPLVPAPGSVPPPARPGRPLVATGDEELLDELLRLAAVAGVAVDVAHDAAALRRCWSPAGLVLVGVDLARSLREAPPPRRSGVLLVRPGRPGGDDPWELAVRVGAEQVAVLPGDAPLVLAELGESGADRREGSRLVAVVGGRGGAGASVLAAAVALAGVRAGLAVCLVDGDPAGGGLDLVLGAEQTAGARWPDLARTRGRLASGALRDALPAAAGLAVLSWDRGPLVDVPVEASRSVVAAAVRAHDLVVVDLPRDLVARADGLGAEVLPGAAATLLVVPGEVRAVAAAAQVARALARATTAARVVVRRSGPGGLGGAAAAAAVGVPCAGELRDDPGLTAALERGDGATRLGRGALGRLADRVVAELPAGRSAA